MFSYYSYCSFVTCILKMLYILRAIYKCLRLQISRSFHKSPSWGMSSRAGRAFNTVDPHLTRKVLLKSFELSNDLSESFTRSGIGPFLYSLYNLILRNSIALLKTYVISEIYQNPRFLIIDLKQEA